VPHTLVVDLVGTVVGRQTVLLHEVARELGVLSQIGSTMATTL
jgi:hypothetical protein